LDSFVNDGNSGCATDTFTYDAASNLTRDRCHKHTCDAWNRLGMKRERGFLKRGQ
jgi:hypothetical protein